MKIYKFKIFGHDYETKVIRRDEDEIVVSINGQEYKAYLESTQRVIAKPTPKFERPAAVPTDGQKVTSDPGISKEIGSVKSPMPGLVLKITVNEGDEVKTGQTVAVIEAMKMQNSIMSNIDGRVKSVGAKEGDTVMEGQELMTIGEN